MFSMEMRVHLMKEDETFVVLAPDGSADGAGRGVFRRDTCYLSELSWALPESVQLSLQEAPGGALREYRAWLDRARAQLVGAERLLKVRADGLDDGWRFTNTSTEPQQVEVQLVVQASFSDVMARWLPDATPRIEVQVSDPDPATRVFEGQASDGVRSSVTVVLAPPPQDQWRWAFKLAPRESREITMQVRLRADDDPGPQPPLPTYSAWRDGFTASRRPEHRQALQRAVDDLRMLLLSTPQGPYPAAGLPNFVNVFGRDAVITAYMLLGPRPELAANALRYLAQRQGVERDVFREEAPGKILHEIRRGELSRTGKIPFGRYYGSIDATPLFVILLEAYGERTGDTALMVELADAWRAALRFIAEHQTENDGLLTFRPSGSGLTVQSWKDSPDSMNHADGTPAQAPLAVAEVQGYGVAALRAGARMERALGDEGAASAAEARAERLAEALHARFWLEDLGVYAMALDRDGRPLRVLSSDPGHLLWAGAVPAEVAARLVSTLTSPPLWSGWGLRTLGSGETRFNPVSYHNGAVWPHDTAMFGGGLALYGFRRELEMVRDALFDLAASQPYQRLPELVSGFEREEGMGPTPYTHACRPQAWAAASLPYLTNLCES